MKIVPFFLFISIFLIKFITNDQEVDVVDKDSSIKKETEMYDSDDLELVKRGPCNIPIETEEITQEDFLTKYAYTSPVIFRIKNKERNSKFKDKCNLHNLIKEYGNKKITVSTANTHSYKKYSMRLSEYLSTYVLPFEESINPKLKYGNETWYFFGENNYTEWKELLDLYERPKYNLPNHEHAYSFGIAAGLTGVPFHFHGPVFAETMVGRKRWFLYPLASKPEFDVDKSTLHWFLETYIKLDENKKPMECILEPLDVIYFPDRWWHATLNVDTVVFISTFLSQIFH
jgi:ribosomal protein L16 Arg81 hydroxylase